MLGSAPPSSNIMVDTYGPLVRPLGDDIVDSTPDYSLFTGAQSPFNLNNCKLFSSSVYNKVQGDHLSGKPGKPENVREFEMSGKCQGFC